MRLLVVASYPPSSDTNGFWAKAWCEALTREHGDVQVHYASRIEGRGPSRWESAPGSSPNPVTVRAVWRREDSAHAIVRDVLAESDRFGPEVAHLHFNYFTYGGPLKSFAVLGGLLSGFSRRGVRTIVTLHSVLASPLRYVFTRFGVKLRTPEWMDRGFVELERFVLDRSLRYADEVVVTSPDALDWLRTHTRIGGSRARFIALGSRWDMRGGIPDRGPAAQSGTPKVPQVTCVGLLVPYKGLENLISAARVLCTQNRPVRITIVGDGRECRPSNRRYVNRLRNLLGTLEDGSVLLETRHLPDREYAQLQQESDVVVLPFRNDGVLGVSGSILDFGGSCRARLVLTDVPRLKGFGGVQGVYYCGDDDPAGLAETIWTAARAPPVDPDERRRALMHYSPDAITARYLESYARLSGTNDLRGTPTLVDRDIVEHSGVRITGDRSWIAGNPVGLGLGDDQRAMAAGERTRLLAASGLNPPSR